MAKVILDQSIRALSGRIGDVVYRRVDGEVIASRRPRPRQSPPTPNQIAVQDRFTTAVQMARAALSDPARRERFERAARGRKRRLFGLAVRDAFHPPAITDVDFGTPRTSGRPVVRIRVEDVIVDKVEVTVRRADETVVASGAAEYEPGHWWFELPIALPWSEVGTIEVTAHDLAGNRTHERFHPPAPETTS